MLAAGQRLAEPYEEIASGQQHIVELTDDLIFCGHVKIDHHISAKDGLKRFLKLKRREQIEAAEGHVVSKSIGNRVLVGAMGNKIPAYPAFRKVRQFILCVNPVLGRLECFGRNVGGQNGAVPVCRVCAKIVKSDHRKGVRLLAGGATGTPHAQIPGFQGLVNPRQYRVPIEIKMILLSEKVGVIGGQLIDENGHLVGGPRIHDITKIIHVVGETQAQYMVAQPSFDQRPLLDKVYPVVAFDVGRNEFKFFIR